MKNMKDMEYLWEDLIPNQSVLFPNTVIYTLSSNYCIILKHQNFIKSLY